MYFSRVLLLFFVLAVLQACSTGMRESENPQLDEQSRSNKKPNILIILADDMGFSDLGCYGSEIKTPNLDKLAYGGLRMTQFYNAGRCCPSRAALLTGQYPHSVGIGEMIKGSPVYPKSYSGLLPDSAMTIAEVLGQAGYGCYISGKWHLAEKTLEVPHPMDRGFERFFGLMQGASSYYNRRGFRNPEDSMTFMLDRAEIYPDSTFYMTKDITDHALDFLQAHNTTKPEDPFFLYLSYTAPHWPLHAPEKDIKAYAGKYDAGWDKIREERYANQLAMDIVQQDFPLSPRNPEVPAWDSVSAEEKPYLIREMETYAAMVTNMDRHIGRVVQYLADENELDNTLIVFLSDNGGCHEEVSTWTPAYEHPKMAGGPESFESYGMPWANVSNTPFRWFKSWVHEGGISTPFIVHYPQGLKAHGKIDRGSYAHIIDLMPTALELAGAGHPETFRGKSTMPLAGKSILPVFRGDTLAQDRPLYWEHMGNMAHRKGDWKLVARKRDWMGDSIPTWELYNLAEDRSELNNLIDQKPEKAQAMLQSYQTWAKRIGVMPFYDYIRLKKNTWVPYKKEGA